MNSRIDDSTVPPNRGNLRAQARQPVRGNRTIVPQERRSELAGRRGMMHSDIEPKRRAPSAAPRAGARSARRAGADRLVAAGHGGGAAHPPAVSRGAGGRPDRRPAGQCLHARVRADLCERAGPRSQRDRAPLQGRGGGGEPQRPSWRSRCRRRSAACRPARSRCSAWCWRSAPMPAGTICRARAGCRRRPSLQVPMRLAPLAEQAMPLACRRRRRRLRRRRRRADRPGRGAAGRGTCGAVDLAQFGRGGA